MKFLGSNPTGLQSRMLRGLLFSVPGLQAEESDMGLRTFTPVGEPLRYNYFPVHVSPTQDLILLQMHPSYHFIVASSLSLDIAYAFWQIPVGFFVLFVSGSSAVSCDFGVFMRGERTSFYSTILSPPPLGTCIF